MRWEDATTKLLEHFVSQWASLHPTVPIGVPNGRALTTPDVESVPWVRISFVPSFSDIVVIGGKTRIQGGRVVCEAFTRLGSGDGVAVGYGTDIEEIWESAQSNGLDGAIHLEAPDPIRSGRDPELPVWHSGVSTPFTIDHTP